MKAQASKKQTEEKFELEEWAFLKLQPYGQLSFGAYINPKLAPWYYGPFKVLEQVGKVSYKLQLLDTTKIHSVFHVPLFKKVVGSYSMEDPLPLSLSNDETVSVIVSITQNIKCSSRHRYGREGTWHEMYLTPQRNQIERVGT